MSALLRLENVHASYGPITALRGLDLTVAPGELVCLIGANGAGKSSTLRAISGLLPPSGGRIVFDGREIQGEGPAGILKTGIAHCPEGRRVFPYLTVEENLAMGAYVRTDRSAIAADMAEVGRHFPILLERRRQMAGTLSGGEQQMLAIARALMARPRLILFDDREIQGEGPAGILKTGIAHCPEGRRVFPYLTVEENLAMGAYVRRDRSAIAADMAEVGRHFPILLERRRQMAGTLSGGEQQMLAIARALMARPRLILFDEPSLGLAPTVVEMTFAIIADIRRRGTTVLMVEQNAYAALRMADRAYVMETGRIVLEGPARDLLDNDHVRRAYLGG